MVWNDYTLISDLGREECVRRLRERMDSPWTLFGKRPVIGHVDERALEMRKRIKYVNAFQPRLSGEIVDEGGRTRLRFQFGMSAPVVVFMTIWFGGLLVFAVQTLFSGKPIWVLVPLLMIATGAAMMRLGRHSEERFLIDFLRSVLDARDS